MTPRPWTTSHAHPHKNDVRREVLEAALFLLGLVAIVAAMSVAP